MLNKEEIENMFQGMEYFVDDDYGGSYKRVVGNQDANSMLGYLKIRDYILNLLNQVEQLEKEKEDSYWQGYIKKQNESVEICKICKYREKYRQLEAELAEANNTINQYKEREQNLIKYLEKEIDNMGSGSSMYLVKLSLKAVLEMMKGEKNE